MFVGGEDPFYIDQLCLSKGMTGIVNEYDDVPYILFDERKANCTLNGTAVEQELLELIS